MGDALGLVRAIFCGFRGVANAGAAVVLCGLAGCDGSDSSSGSPPPVPPPTASAFSIGGTVSGLSGSTLKLRDNGGDELAVTSDGAFTFATELSAGTAYNVSVGVQPNNQLCTIANGTGTVSNADVSNVAVSCAAQADVVIAAMDPTHGKAGISVTLTGSGFDPDKAHNDVRLNNVPCTVTAATATELTVEVPSNAGSGEFAVAVNSKSAESPLFTYDLTGVTVSTVAGGAFGFQDGPIADAKFASPSGVALNPVGGNILVADVENNRIRSIGTTLVSTLAGSTEGDSDGNGQQAQFSGPYSLIADNLGNVYVSDGVNNKIRQITPQGEVSTFASGLANPAQLTFGSGGVVVADKGNHRILLVGVAGGPVTLAGGNGPGDTDGPIAQAQLQFPSGVAFCTDGLYIADEFNMKIRKVANGQVTTYTGSASGVSYQDGTLAEARFLFPVGLACDRFGKLFVVDTGNEKIRMITPAGIVITLAGSSVGFADGDGATAKFSVPQFIEVESDSSLLVADSANNRIRRISWR